MQCSSCMFLFLSRSFLTTLFRFLFLDSYIVGVRATRSAERVQRWEQFANSLSETRTR